MCLIVSQMRALLSFFFAAGLVLGQNASKAHNDPYVHGPKNEARLAQEVRHQLVMLPYYTVFDDLAFRIDGSTVTLLGAVTRPVLKSDAEGVVKTVEGVSQVVNQIEVLPLSPMDDQIRRAMLRTIYGDPQIGTRYGQPGTSEYPHHREERECPAGRRGGEYVR